MEKKTGQLDVWLSEAVAKLRSDGKELISRIPPAARNVKMGDLQDKYGGDIMAIKEAPQTDESCKRCKRRRCKHIASSSPR